MSISNVAAETQFRRSHAPTLSPTTPGDTDSDTELSASLLREKELLRELSVLAQQQDLMAEEFEHRLGNSLQMIVSLLTGDCTCMIARRASTSNFICKACVAISPT